MPDPVSQLAVPSHGKLCPECGYDLRGIASLQCPECGLNANDPNYSSIPWANRARIGRVKAFCKTALLVTFRPKRFALAVERPVDFRSAERFRWIVVLLATLPMVVLVLAVAWQKKTGLRILDLNDFMDLREIPSGLRSDLMLIWLVGYSLMPIIPAATFVSLLLWSAAPGNILFRRARASRLSAESRGLAAEPLCLRTPGGSLSGCIDGRVFGLGRGIRRRLGGTVDQCF